MLLCSLKAINLTAIEAILKYAPEIFFKELHSIGSFELNTFKNKYHYAKKR
jgi:hypothetical protein